VSPFQRFRTSNLIRNASLTSKNTADDGRFMDRAPKDRSIRWRYVPHPISVQYKHFHREIEQPRIDLFHDIEGIVALCSRV
jgi:hypothetical protein